jgi:hypothetical protein
VTEQPEHTANVSRDQALMSALVLEVRAMRAEVHELRDSIDHLARRTLEREDRRVGEALLPLACELIGAETFTSVALAAAALNERTVAGQAVRELIAEYCSSSGGLRALGKLLARLDGIALAEHRLVPAGEHRAGRAWRVERVSGD